MSPPLHLPRWEFTLQSLTPAFIGGAQPRRVDDVVALRPASLRGVLRSWFRLGMASLIRPAGPAPLDREVARAQLHRLEQELFGSVHEGSLVVILPPSGGQIRTEPPPDQKSERGLRYLGYGLFDGREAPSCLFATATAPVVLRVGLRVKMSDPRAANAAQALIATLWLWANLGGIGARSRRGFGAFEIREARALHDGFVPWDGPAFGERAADLMGLLKLLDTGISRALNAYREFARDVLKFTEKTPLPAKDSKVDQEMRSLSGLTQLRVLPWTFTKAGEALEQTGRLFQDFRSTLRRNAQQMQPLPDYFEVKSARLM